MSPTRLARLSVSCLLLLAIHIATASAGWNPNGNPICTAAGTQQFHSGIPDGTGGVYIAWLDARGGNNVYAQHILANGTIAPGWPVNGLAVTSSGNSGLPNVCSDGSGGLLLVFWLSGIRAQRILADGSVAPGFPAGGKLITTNMASYFTAVTDGAGGAYILKDVQVSFELYRSTYLTRITVDGAIASPWSVDGLFLAGGDFGFASGAKLLPTPEGHALVSWSFYSDAAVDYKWGELRRFRRDGSVALNVGCAAPLSGGRVPGVGPVLANHDGLGGIVATWTDTQPTSPPPYTGQSGSFGGRWSASSVLQWPNPTPMPMILTPVPDGTGAAYLMGRPAGQNAYYAFRRAADGSIPAGWTAAGIPLSNPLSTQALSSDVVSTGLLSCWSENTSGAGLDIRAVVLASGGTVAPGWAAGGTAVCTAPGDQTTPVLIQDGFGGMYACWMDQRDNATTGTDIYLARLVTDGVVAAQASLAGASAEPGVIRLHWYSPDGASFRATLERSAGSTEFATLAQVQADGTGNVRYEDRDVAPGVTYRYRLAVEDGSGRHTLGEVSLRVPGVLRLALEPARPNPSSGPFTLAFTLPSAAPTLVELFDVSGRRVYAQTIEPARTGLRLLPVSAELRPGLYVARLTHGGRSVTTRVVHAE